MKEVFESSRPDWIPEEIWDQLSWREQDLVILMRKNLPEKIIQRRLYIRSERTFIRIKAGLREKLEKLRQNGAK